MIKEMITIASDCIANPRTRAVWSPELNAYVCPDTDQGKSVSTDRSSRQYPPLDPKFKLVFVTAASGTLLFVLICVGLTLARDELPDIGTKLVEGLFDLAKIGFGAVVGLLGGQQLRAGAAVDDR